jgi:uncharacterized OsmC-like protein
MKTMTTVNGVAVDRLVETIDHLKANPGLGEFRFRTKNRWINGTHSRAENWSFYGAGSEDVTRRAPHVHEMDEPPLLLGEDQGSNPGEHLLNALSGCVTTTFIAYASAQGVKIDELRTELEGDIDLRGFLGISDDVRPGFREIRVKFFVKSKAPPEKIRELIQLTGRRSAVTDSLSRGVPIHVALSD